MVTEITRDQAAQLYLTQLQSEAAKLTPVDREIKRFMVVDPRTTKMVFLSYVDLITNVQNRSQIGMKKAVEYVQQLKTPDDEQMYIIK